MSTSDPSPSRRHILRIAIGAGMGAAVGSIASMSRAHPQPASLTKLLPQIKFIREKLHPKARQLADAGHLVRPDGFIYTVDAAQLMIYFAQAGDLEPYLAMRNHAAKNLILNVRDGTYTKGFVAWRWKPGAAPDASGTTEALRVARGLWLGSKAFDRPADAELALEVLDGYSRHGIIDQRIWIIRNYYNLLTRSFSNNSYLVDYDADFIREVADRQKDQKLAKLADDSYQVMKMAIAPSGLLYDIIQPEVSTLYPELNLAAYSPNDVIQFSNCCASAMTVAQGLPEIPRKILAMGLNRLEDLRVYYLGRTGEPEPQSSKSATVSEYSVLARLAARLGAEIPAATIAERAMNDWLWCANHLEGSEVFMVTEILLAMQALEGMKA